MNTIVVALIVSLGTVLSPALLSYLTGRQRRQEKAEDYARLDAVAARAEAIAGAAAAEAAAVASQAAHAAELLLESNERVAAAAAAAATTTTGQLDQIHVLVNSDRTSSLASELAATELALVSMREIVDLKRALGQQPAADAATVIELTEARIAELRAQLSDRRRQTEVADAQALGASPTGMTAP